MRYTHKSWFTGDAPCFVISHKRFKGPTIADNEKEKLLKVQRNNYFGSGEKFLSITHLFLVEKSDDIKMVYSDIPSDFNGVLWAPHLTLPTMSTQMIAIKCSTNMGVLTLEKQF